MVDSAPDFIRDTPTAPRLQATDVRLNGQELRLLGAGDELPALQGQRIPTGAVEFAPQSITFLALAETGNASCR